jgi:hypothetical protein
VSSGLNCSFIEPAPGCWYYLLENWDAPKGAFDWREFATGYGPFASFEQADEHLSDNHSNPDGYSVTDHAEYKTDAVLEELIANAQAPSSRRTWR